MKKKNATKPRDKNKTEQDVGTDPKLFQVLDEEFNFVWDLACNEDNCLVKSEGVIFYHGFTYPEHDALKESWFPIVGFDYYHPKWLFLNPPYKNIEPWAKRCYLQSLMGAKIVMLTPASVGTRWFEEWVYDKAMVKFLIGRPTFKGHDKPYPKDMMISIFDNFNRGFGLWDWKKEIKHLPD